MYSKAVVDNGIHQHVWFACYTYADATSTTPYLLVLVVINTATFVLIVRSITINQGLLSGLPALRTRQALPSAVGRRV